MIARIIKCNLSRYLAVLTIPKTNATRGTSFTATSHSRKVGRMKSTNSRFQITTKFSRWSFSIKRKISIMIAFQLRDLFPRWNSPNKSRSPTWRSRTLKLGRKLGAGKFGEVFLVSAQEKRICLRSQANQQTQHRSETIDTNDPRNQDSELSQSSQHCKSCTHSSATVIISTCCWNCSFSG